MKKYRRGVFFVVYVRNKKGNLEYLILKRKLHWKGWEFPKGGVEKIEKTIDSVRREVKEETGLIPLKIKKFDISGKYKYGKELKDRKGFIGQTFEAVYSIEVKKEEIKLSKEHSDYKWLNFKQAFKKLTWSNQKNCLKTVNEWLEDIKKIKPREFVTSSGASVFIGRNSSNNEDLVNYFKGKENTIIHTAAPGSPFGVIDKINPSETLIHISGAAVVSYSQDWRDNKSDTSVDVFTGKDVYKRKGMKTGTFGVKNAKKIKVKKKDVLSLERKK